MMNEILNLVIFPILGPDPCVLNCLPKGGRQYFRQALKVHDGTKCYEDGSLDVCVDGICLVSTLIKVF